MTKGSNTWSPEGVESGSEWDGSTPAHVLDVRPLLNFLAVDRLDLLPRLLGPPVLLPAAVTTELRSYVKSTAKELQQRIQRHPDTVDAFEIAHGEKLGRWVRKLREAPIRFLRDVSAAELEEATVLMQFGTLDPGESELLAIARLRGWVAVIDELAAHCLAEASGLANTSTLQILVRGVRRRQLDVDEASVLWSEMQRWWDYAPPGALLDYLSGVRPIWRPCPDSW